MTTATKASEFKSDAPLNNGTITDFKSEYEAALADARVQAEHTATDGWKSIYRTHKKALSKAEEKIANDLRILAKKLENEGWDEDDEKLVKEAAKASAELRATDAAFYAEVLRHVCDPVFVCDRLRRDYLLRAEREERMDPLYTKGLSDRMKKAIDAQPVPVWNEQEGVVTVKEN